VQTVELSGDHVRVEFTVDRGVDFGKTTGAAIKVKTLLGAMYLGLEPGGEGQLPEGAVIPTSRTTSPYDVVQAFSGLANRSERIDTDRLATSLNTLATLTQDTPQEFRAALSGLSDLSRNIAARDEQLNTLLRNMKKVSTVLGDRRGDLVTLMRDGNQLFRALAARRESVHNLLVSTSQLSAQLTGLVRDTRADLKPALDHLGNVVDVLNKNQQNLDNSLRLMAPFYRVFANTLGNGPWFDTYIQNLPPAPRLQVGG
jgi:phospholipid/cholesterol/gamma-HCH transport system substrate-binding protein